MIFSEILILVVTIQLTIIIFLADPSENAIYGKSITFARSAASSPCVLLP